MMFVPDLKSKILEWAVLAGLGLFVVRYLAKEFGDCVAEIIRSMKTIKDKWNGA